MAKYAGLVTYVSEVESRPGIWTEESVSRLMRGDMLRKTLSVQNDDKVNSDISLNHRVSLVGDEFALNNYYGIKHIQIDGRDWEVTSVEVQHPRLIVTVGGLWNG